jgi:hypothetical protein
MNRVVVLLLLAALAACGGGGAPQESTAPVSTAPARERPVDFLASAQTFDVPDEPRAAAAVLVAKARDPGSGAAAVREVLTRTGVAIISVDGTLLNKPAMPAKLGVQIYDFQVPMLAESLQEDRTVKFSRVADLAPALIGAALPEGVVRQAFDRWLQAAPAEAGNPEALDAALVAEFARAAGETPSIERMPVLAYILVVSDFYGFKGTVRQPDRLSLALPIASARASVPCPEEKYDPVEGTWQETGKKALDWALELAGPITGKFTGRLGRNFEASKKAWEQTDTFEDFNETLNSVMARAALVQGLKVAVENDAGSKKLHRRHARAYNQFVTFKATVRFETPWPAATVTCGPLRGYVIPNNSTVSGIWVRWDLLGSDLQTSDTASSQSLHRGGGGGAATGDDGTTQLETETTFEDGCPSDDSKCAKGNLANASSGAKAWLDLTRTPPVKIQDLLMAPQPTNDAAKAIFKVLMDVVTDLVTASNSATSMVRVERHQLGRYRFKGTESVGNFNVTVEGESEAGLYGKWKVKWTAVSKTRNTENRIELVEDVVTSEEPGNLGEIRGQGTVVSSVHFGDVSSENKGDASVAGTATIGGGLDRPTITLTTTEFKMTMAGSGNAGGEAFTSNADLSGARGQAAYKAAVEGAGGRGSVNRTSVFTGRSRTYDVELVK